MSDPGLPGEILRQIQDALLRIERRFSVITSPEDFLATDDGIDRLDAICMMLIAIGESLKNLDKITNNNKKNMGEVPLFSFFPFYESNRKIDSSRPDFAPGCAGHLRV